MQTNVVKVVMVKMVIFIFGYVILLTIYKYRIFIIVADFDTCKIDFDHFDLDHRDRILIVLRLFSECSQSPY